MMHYDERKTSVILSIDMIFPFHTFLLRFKGSTYFHSDSFPCVGLLGCLNNGIPIVQTKLLIGVLGGSLFRRPMVRQSRFSEIVGVKGPRKSHISENSNYWVCLHYDTCH